MHRLMWGMAVCDILCSLWYFASTWPIPAGTLDIFFGAKLEAEAEPGQEEEETLDGEDVIITQTIFWAVGDTRGISCTVSGFFNQFAVAIPLYNVMLSVFYLLVVKFGWRDARIAKWEWLFHVVPWGYALFTSTFAVIADLYGYVPWTCWILPSALFEDEWETIRTPIQARFQLIQWVFLFGIVWACIVIESLIFGVLFLKMKTLETKMQRHSQLSSGSLGLPNYTQSSIRTGRQQSTRTERRPPPLPPPQPTTTEGEEEEDRSHNSSLPQESDREESDEENENENEMETDLEQDGSRKLEEEKEDNPVAVVVEKRGSTAGPTSMTTSTVTNHTDRSPSVSAAAEAEEENDVATELRGPRNQNRNTKISWIGKLNSSFMRSSKSMRRSTTHNNTAMSTNTNTNLGSGTPSSASIRNTTNNASRDNSTSSVDTTIRDRRNRRRERRAVVIAAKKSHKIAIQGLLYVGAFFITWFFPTMTRITELVRKENYFVIQFFDTTMLPLQGFLNFVIYIRPRFLLARQRQPEQGFWKTLYIVVVQND